MRAAGEAGACNSVGIFPIILPRTGSVDDDCWRQTAHLFSKIDCIDINRVRYAAVSLAKRFCLLKAAPCDDDIVFIPLKQGCRKAASEYPVSPDD